MDIQHFIWLWFLQLLACASCDNCPPVENISPCECRSSIFYSDETGNIAIECNGVSWQEIDEVFEHLRGKAVYDATIQNVKGDRLPSNLFRNLSVTLLTIEDCDLRGLSDTKDGQAFMGLENSLQRLYVRRSIKGDNQLKKLDLSHLQKLNFLVLEANNIPEVGNDWFARGPLSLVSVAIIDCGLNKLGDTAFAPLVNLRNLVLYGNRLTSIERSMIVAKRAPGFKFLSLGNNNFSRLPNDIFSGMPSLHRLNLEGNSIGRMEETTWSSQWEKLRYLYIEGNPLECDSHMEWMFSLKKIRYVSGYCASPDKLEGMTLRDFIESNRRLM